MSVNLEPQELGFKRPFTHEVSQVLRLHNPNNDPVAFKVKTTAPKQYCVRPNSGRIDAGGDVEVQVLLQAMKEDPPPDARCRDKFLVQSVAIAAEQADGNITQIWANTEQTAKSSIQERKIRVSFLPAEGGAGAATPVAASTAAATTNGVHDDELAAPSSPSPPAVTPQRVRGDDSVADSTLFGSTVAASALGSAAATVSNATGLTQDDLKKQLDEAKAQIARLQAQAAEATGLRQRKTESSSADASTEKSSSSNLATKQPPAGGVPVFVVALLCLITFLIAFFLF